MNIIGGIVIMLAIYGLIRIFLDIRASFTDWSSAQEQAHNIVFQDPRVLMHGERYDAFRAKLGRREPQKPVGNEVQWNFKKRTCAHVYFPTKDIHTGKLTGQECALCHRVNTIAELEAMWSREGLSR